MQNFGNFLELQIDQVYFDELINKLDRRIFYLRERISYENYIKELSGKSYKTGTVIGPTVETGFTIDWLQITPKKWLELNPYFLTSYEQPFNLISYFDGSSKLISRQSLSFYNKHAAEHLCILFRKNSNWVIYDDTVSKSKDNKYTVVFTDHTLRDGFHDIEATIQIGYK